MLHLAAMMQYEDDFDDQNFYGNQANRNRNRKQSSSSSEEEVKNQTNAQINDDDEEENDLDIELLIERQESIDEKARIDYQFQENDEKKIKKQQLKQ